MVAGDAADDRVTAGSPQRRDRRPPAASRFALRFIETYQAQVSGRLGTSCRFEPTCSEYARQAFLAHGFLRATRLTAARLRRCRGGSGPVVLDPL